MKHQLGIAALLLAAFTAAKAWFSAETGWELSYPLDAVVFVLTSSAAIVLGLLYVFGRKAPPTRVLIGQVVLSLSGLMLIGWCALGCPDFLVLAFWLNGYSRWEINRSFDGPARFPSLNNSMKVVMYEHPCGGIGDTGVMLVLEGFGPFSKVMLIRDQGGFTTDCISGIRWLDTDRVRVDWLHAQPMILSIWDKPVYMRVD